MNTIPLGGKKGGVALVDDEDYGYLSTIKWHMQDSYVVHSNGAYAKEMMHRVVMAKELLTAPKDTQIDHIDGNGLNNQKSNLRLCTGSQNATCSKRRSTNKYRGVHLHQGRYAVYIFVDKKKKFMGSFDTEEMAAFAYDLAAKKYYGEFATLNFPENDNK